MMKLASWNVNGLRACQKKGFLDWVKKEAPSVICLQETKANEEQLDDSILNIPGYHSYFASAEKKGYSGVALYVSDKISNQEIIEGIGIEKFDNEGRTLTLICNDFILINGYFPNGQRDHNRVPFKLEYSYEVAAIAKDYLKKNKKVLICGDLNTAHHPIDLRNPKTNLKSTGFLPIERKFMDDMEADSFNDIFRELHPDEPDHYSWWTYRGDCRARNIGWRIDYFMGSPAALKGTQKCYYQPKVMGSDHCPIILELN